MKIGFSLSPGGLLLPYHLGVLKSLSDYGHIQDSTPLAGSSAGAIAVSAHASGVPSLMALEASTRISGMLLGNPLFVPSGSLLPALRNEMNHLLPMEAHELCNEREGIVALAHRELFPRNRPILQTHFETRQSLMDAVCDSSMFPYFLTNKPIRMVRRKGRILPRMVVDGLFACSAERIGCPDFEQCCETTTTTNSSNQESKKVVDRTVMVSVFPTEFLSLTTTPKKDQIGPVLEENFAAQAVRLVRLATQGATSKELHDLYEQGCLDAQNWATQEERKERESSRSKRRVARQQAP
ncbi:Patatin-like phospholipase [Seminavis robusta]|uniref:Patatin-like phospholipase n=1 Tax=Seminavis robusta TaxID=568900 RepID=A0A9N8DVT7_9STRA|nr:Patatin-like phospholipase [Seminavis robusta]|eukprot:Sro410_g137410.1 Patatin-like phospholipase (296) ;mRNA; r:42132-43019